MDISKSRVLALGLAFVAVAFGLLTIRQGGMVLFGPQEARQAAGDYVPFVLWSNFLAGFAYVAAGVAIAWNRRWASPLALSILLISGLVFLGLLIHILSGGIYEQRTVFAMALRVLVWLAIFFLLWRMTPSRRTPSPR